MNEQLLKDNGTQYCYKEEAIKVLDILRELPENKRTIAVAIANAYIDGMKAQEVLEGSMKHGWEGKNN